MCLGALSMNKDNTNKERAGFVESSIQKLKGDEQTCPALNLGFNMILNLILNLFTVQCSWGDCMANYCVNYHYGKRVGGKMG